MAEWQPIETAPRDGTVIQYRRMYEGREMFKGRACWRAVTFGALFDPLTGERIADAYRGAGWMYPDRKKRVPEPTHWMPIAAQPNS